MGVDRPIGCHHFHEYKERIGWPQVHQQDVREVPVSGDLESNFLIKKAGVGDLVEIRKQDIRNVDLSPASVLTMYLLPEVNLMIRPNIRNQMKPGSRVVSHDFDMGDWKPLKTETIKDGSSWEHTLYLWQVEAGKK